MSRQNEAHKKHRKQKNKKPLAKHFQSESFRLSLKFVAGCRGEAKHPANSTVGGTAAKMEIDFGDFCISEEMRDKLGTSLLEKGIKFCLEMEHN